MIVGQDAASIPIAASRWTRLDTIIAVAVGVAALLTGTWYQSAYRTAGAMPVFYQEQFAPAVMLACGRGFVNIETTSAPPALERFLAQRVDAFSCQDLSPSIQVIPINGFQGMTRYLMTAVAVVWRATGISWRSLDGLASALFAVSLATAYVVLRMMAGRTLSMLAVVLWASSPRHLENMPHLRDYSKAPFFVLMLLATVLAFVERKPARLIALGIVFGIVQAVGFGMRTDAMLNFVPFLVILVAGAPDGMFRQLGPRVASAAASVAVFALFAMPILRTYKGPSQMWHVILLGLSAPHDDILNLNVPRPPYTFPYANNDGYIETVVRSYSSRYEPADPPIRIGRFEYDPACRAFYRALAKTFPADIGARVAAAAIYVSNLPFLLDGRQVPVGVVNTALVRLSQARASWLMKLQGIGPLALAAGVVLLGLEQIRYTVIAFLLICFLTGYPFLQFEDRHIFQLEFLVFGIIVLDCVLARRWFIRARDWHVGFRQIVKPVAAAGGLLAGVVLTVSAARAIQVPRVRALLTSYDQAPTTRVSTMARSLDEGEIRLETDLFGPPLAGDHVQTAMIVAGFSPDACGRSSTFYATFRYAEADPRLAMNFSRRTMVRLGSGPQPTRVFLPVYSVDLDGTAVSRFVGLDVPAAKAPCVQLSRVRDLEQLPLLLPATLAPDWQHEALYERVRLDTAVPPILRRAVAHWWPALPQLG